MQNGDTPFTEKLQFLCQRVRLCRDHKTSHDGLGDGRKSKYWSTPRQKKSFFFRRPTLGGRFFAKNMDISRCTDFLREYHPLGVILLREAKEEIHTFQNLLELLKKLVWRRSYSDFCVARRSRIGKWQIKKNSSPSTTPSNFESIVLEDY